MRLNFSTYSTTRRWFGRVAVGSLTAAFVIPGLVLAVGQVGAGAAVKAPAGFCADMTKVAETGTVLAKDPSTAAGDEAIAAVKVASKAAPEGATGDVTTDIASDMVATEALYGDMWADDVVAMEGYHTSSFTKATAELIAVDDYVTQACPTSAKALKALKTLDKKKSHTKL
jgi:hypothetical protein